MDSEIQAKPVNKRKEMFSLNRKLEKWNESVFDFSAFQAENMNPGPTGRSRRETFPKALSFRKRLRKKLFAVYIERTGDCTQVWGREPWVTTVFRGLLLSLNSLTNKRWVRRLPAAILTVVTCSAVRTVSGNLKSCFLKLQNLNFRNCKNSF